MTEEDLIGRQRRGTEIPVELGVTPLPPDADARILVTIRDASAQARIAGLLRRTRESIEYAAFVGSVELFADLPMAQREQLGRSLDEALALWATARSSK